MTAERRLRRSAQARPRGTRVSVWVDRRSRRESSSRAINKPAQHNPYRIGKIQSRARRTRSPSMATLLEQLRTMTKVVADSGDINSIEKFKPTDSTTNPSLIAAAAEMPAYAPIVDDVLMQAREHAGPNASDKDV